MKKTLETQSVSTLILYDMKGKEEGNKEKILSGTEDSVTIVYINVS